MRVQSKPPRKKVKNLPLGTKKGVHANKVTLPPVGKAKPVEDLEETLGTTGPSPEQLGALSKRVGKAVELQVQIESIEEMLKAHKEELHLLTTRELPDMLAAAGTTLYKTDAGVKVEIKEFMNGSLPKEETARNAALAWLEQNGARDLIKTSFFVGLGRGQKEDAKALRKALKQTGVTYQEKEDVNAQSLYSFARERVKAGEPLPLDLLGLYAGRVAKIELPK